MNLQIELTKFKDQVLNNYKFNPNNIIYLRLSKLDNKLNEEERIKETLNKLKADLDSILKKYSYLLNDGFYLSVEVKSAYKNSEREEFIKVYEDNQEDIEKFIITTLKNNGSLLAEGSNKYKKIFMLHYHLVISKSGSSTSLPSLIQMFLP